MNLPVYVKIIAAPVACEGKVKDTWRDLAKFVAEKLHVQFGKKVEVIYYDLLLDNCPPLPPDAQLPIVFVNDEVLSNGGKLSLPLIRKKIESLGI